MLFALHAGPKITGNASFDKCCVYGNKVALKRSQVQFLQQLARMRPSLKVSVCTMTAAHTEKPKAKMVNKLSPMSVFDC
jgi:hypothetical protein